VDEVLTEDQQLLLEGSSRFMEESFPLAAVRRLGSEVGAPPPSYRLRSADLGWYSMLVPAALGGGSVSGNGVVDAALIAYRRGRALQPGSFVTTNVVALALAAAGSGEQRDKVLPALISGQAGGAWLGLDYDDPARTILRAESLGAGYRLSGGPISVQELEADSWLLLTTEHEGGLSQFLLEPEFPGVTIAARQSLDLSRRTSLVAIDGIEVTSSALVGAPGEAKSVVAEQLAVACVLTAAESVGAMDRDFQTALQYAKDRTAFGRPIGSFQAVKHQLADTSLLLEMSKGAVLAAAASLGEGDDHGLQAASMAKALVAEHSVELAQTCFQVFGGIGFTWEHDQHLFLRRMTSDAAMYGGAAWHREHVCQLAGL
jgi:alkylation response protein AidB-like acyl-CoA dehydrogenase